MLHPWYTAGLLSRRFLFMQWSPNTCETLVPSVRHDPLSWPHQETCCALEKAWQSSFAAAKMREVAHQISNSISIYPPCLQWRAVWKWRDVLEQDGMRSTSRRDYHLYVNRSRGLAIILSPRSIYEDVWMYSFNVTLSSIGHNSGGFSFVGGRNLNAISEIRHENLFHDFDRNTIRIERYVVQCIRARHRANISDKCIRVQAYTKLSSRWQRV